MRNKDNTPRENLNNKKNEHNRARERRPREDPPKKKQKERNAAAKSAWPGHRPHSKGKIKGEKHFRNITIF
jgi:hypothetical protein